MTIDELQVEATKLPRGERAYLVHILLRDEQIEQWDQARLKAEVQIGVDQLAHGEARSFGSDEELHAFFEEIKAQGRQRLAENGREAGL
jgi:hypothetical protein